MALNPKTFHASSWAELTAILHLKDKCYFRGQKKASWSLRPSIERMYSGQNLALNNVEDELLRIFKSSATRLIAPQAIPRADLDWFALMQHYGAPTRLLDWTDSCYVAAYFALEKAHCVPCAVWAIDKFALFAHARSQTTVRDGFALPSPALAGYDHKKYHEFLLNRLLPGVFPIRPLLQPERLYLQQGLFLATSNAGRGFEDELAKMEHFQVDRDLYCISIDPGAAVEGIRELGRMNVSRATLFLGLDGLAQSLNHIEFQSLSQGSLFQASFDSADDTEDPVA